MQMLLLLLWVHGCMLVVVAPTASSANQCDAHDETVAIARVLCALTHAVSCFPCCQNARCHVLQSACTEPGAAPAARQLLVWCKHACTGCWVAPLCLPRMRVLLVVWQGHTILPWWWWSWPWWWWWSWCCTKAAAASALAECRWAVARGAAGHASCPCRWRPGTPLAAAALLSASPAPLLRAATTRITACVCVWACSICMKWSATAHACSPRQARNAHGPARRAGARPRSDNVHQHQMGASVLSELRHTYAQSSACTDWCVKHLLSCPGTAWWVHMHATRARALVVCGRCGHGHTAADGLKATKRTLHEQAYG